jgi:ATP-dependent DNA helicase RecQ
MSSRASADDVLTCMRERFGHESFHAGQREIVDAVLGGRDAMAILPTGGGKSVTYELPALLSGKPTLVVSPLIALMRDQVSRATSSGLRAAAVDSVIGDGARAEILHAIREGRLDLIYASPEGLPRLLREMGEDARIGLLAVDEAHCISEWGHDFRPHYRLLGDARARIHSGIPVLAVTATATTRVADDIALSLRLHDPFVFRGSFFRQNLRLAARRKDPASDARLEVMALLHAHEGEAAIVYRASRAGAASLALWLRRRGVQALVYHAGLDAARRAEVQDAFASGECAVVVATVAFGMGVDKRDVRLVVHADLPGSLEAYAQEVGRAGRDGLPSDCVLLYAWSDVRRADALAGSLTPARRASARAAVRETFRFAASAGCRHRRLCAHFGEQVTVPCGACDHCGALSPARLLVRGGW